MNEARFNTIIRNSLIDISGFAYKISDVGGGSQQRRPFDGIATYNGQALFWEAKLSKGIKAFNLGELFEGTRGHQMETFNTIHVAAPNVELRVILCCYIPSRSRVYVFEYQDLKTLFDRGVTSLLKVHLEALPHANIFKDRITNMNPIDGELIAEQVGG